MVAQPSGVCSFSRCRGMGLIEPQLMQYRYFNYSIIITQLQQSFMPWQLTRPTCMAGLGQDTKVINSLFHQRGTARATARHAADS